MSPISPLHINGDDDKKGLFLEEANVVFSKPRNTTDSANLSLFRDYNEWAQPHGVLRLRPEGGDSSAGSTIFSIDAPFSNPTEATLGLVLSDGIWNEIVDLYNMRGTSNHWGFNYIKDGSEAQFRPFAISFQDGFGGPETRVLEILHTGNVGIGTTNPGARLEIQGPGDNLKVGNALVVKDGGNVGIGTMSPTARLEVQGDITVSGNVDGRDISVDGTKLDELFQPWKKARYEFTNLSSKQLVQWSATQNIIFVRVSPPSGGSCTAMMTANGGSGVGYNIGWTSVGQCTSGNSITITSNGTGHPQFTLSVDPGGGRLYITPVSGTWTGTTYVDVLTVYW